MSLADMTSARSSPVPETCPDCDTSASVTSDLHKYQVACTCKNSSAQYACAEEPGPPAPAKSGDVPPALPPRPAAALAATNRRNNAALPTGAVGEGPATCTRRRKYAWWCVGCGALAAALGGLLAAAHILLRAYTASPHHLETVPAAVPAAMLVLTGVCIMSLARRRNRYSYMIKVVGACCLVCALTCVLVTITTTVIHMNKLQTLKFCEYTKLTRTCTCFSLPPDHHHAADEDEGVRCVFEGVTDCGVVHGVLYWCLRGVFALSVTAVLVCIFSSMLAYQLLSHERKKMYWEQLELRCRSLYRPPAGAAVPRPRPPPAQCACCQQCHPPQPAWDISLQHRFWAPGRIGNLYSPNPGTMRKTSAWSWFPWPRTNSQRCRMGAAPQSGDSAYGFCDESPPQEPRPASGPYEARPYPAHERAAAAFGTLPRAPPAACELQDGVWGPPPPYSPQGRGASRHHLHQDPAATTLLHHHHIDMHRNSMPAHEHAPAHTCAAGRASFMGHMIHPNAQITADVSHFAPEMGDMGRMGAELMVAEMGRMGPDLMVAEMDRMGPEMGRMAQGCMSEMGRYSREAELVHLQSEMARLGEDAGRCSTLRGHLVQYNGCQRMLGVSMGNLHRECGMRDDSMAVDCVRQGGNGKDQNADCNKHGKENLAFQNDKHSPIRSSLHLECRGNPHTESEVYFADVSSCCNISVKADCCANPNVSALVGTIENHPESTSGESDNGSFTLTRQQRPQPQTLGSKRRPRPLPGNEKARIAELNNSVRNHDDRITDLNSMARNQDCRVADLNNSLRGHEVRMADLNASRNHEVRICDLNNSIRILDLNNSVRNHDGRIIDLNNCARSHDARMGDMSHSARIHSQDMNMLLREQFDRQEQLNCSVREQLNSSIREQLNTSMRHSENSPPIHMCENSLSELNNSMRLIDNHGSPLHSIRDHHNTSMQEQRRVSDQLNNSIRTEKNDSSILDDSRMSRGSPKIKNQNHHISPGLRKVQNHRSSPKSSSRDSPLHPRQSSSDSNVSHKNLEFFVPPPPVQSPLSPRTEESLVSDEELERSAEVFEKSETMALGPDLQYEPVREVKNNPIEEFKPNHNHCYSDTNTMDSGWQSGSEKHVTD